jgi:hypothetical protein
LFSRRRHLSFVALAKEDGDARCHSRESGNPLTFPFTFPFPAVQYAVWLTPLHQSRGTERRTYMNLEELKQFIKQVGPSRLGLAGKEEQL